MRRRALVFYPRLAPLGGAKGVAAWILQALLPDHEVTLLGYEAPDLQAVDRRYGTSLARGGVRVEVERPVLPRWVPAGRRLDTLRMWALQRAARRAARRFDLVVSAANEADLGDGTIQYVHDPAPAFREGTTRLDAACLAAGARLTGFRYERMRRNLTLVPSAWIAARVRSVHGIEARVVYPPAAGEFPQVAWNERSNGVVCCGRLWPDRKVETAIDIVERVRRQGLPVTLTLIGGGGVSRNREVVAYAERIRSLVRERRDWITLREDVDRADLGPLMASHRYGLAVVTEGFGMAAAELVRAGAIVFLPGEGGQAEIAGGDARFLYATAEEAAGKLAEAVRDTARQETLRAVLEGRRGRFTTERFVRDLRQAVGV